MFQWLLSGEDCTAGSRVYVQDSVYDKFVDILIEKVKSTPIGDGFNETVTGGPIVSGRAAPRSAMVLREILIDLEGPVR